MTPITWSELTERVGYPLMYAKLWGSRSHNTHLPDSDWDYLAVYQAPTAAILSLKGEDGQPRYLDTVDGKAPDFEAHEVGKFCELLLKGNPATLEMLFTNSDQFIGAQLSWGDLVVMRQEFISRRAVKQYLGYARGQLRRLDEGRPLHTSGGLYNTKWAYHIVRLCADAKRLAAGAGPLVWKDEGTEEWQFLMSVRQNKVPRDAITERLERTIVDIGDIETLPLPAEGPREWLNDWLLTLRAI